MFLILEKWLKTPRNIGMHFHMHLAQKRWVFIDAKCWIIHKCQFLKYCCILEFSFFIQWVLLCGSSLTWHISTISHTFYKSIQHMSYIHYIDFISIFNSLCVRVVCLYLFKKSFSLSMLVFVVHAFLFSSQCPGLAAFVKVGL